THHFPYSHVRTNVRTFVRHSDSFCRIKGISRKRQSNRNTPMSDLRSATSRATLLDNLYAAAETLLQAVADPIIIDEAPLHHRAQALDAIGRFIDRIEKREATRHAIQPQPEPEEFDPDVPIYT